MNEDAAYRASTQYRLWSYTPESLASLRATTTASAASRVTAAILRARAASTASPSTSTPVDCLTPAEALLLVHYYSAQLLRVSDAVFSFPTAVKATAVAYMQRFYLANSPMTYHPKTLFPTCLFLATKTENNYISLSAFAAELARAGLRAAPDDVVAPEFVLTQGLRFTFEVRHPHRGLRGGLLELLAMARGEEGVLLPGLGIGAEELRREMMALPPAGDGNTEAAAAAAMSQRELEDRCGAAHDAAKTTLGAAALLTDAYFLYTPSQIWLAALLLADEPLTLFYLRTKFPGGAAGADTGAAARFAKALAIVRRCAGVLEGYESTLRPEAREELVRIDKKLYACLNPERARDVAAGGGKRVGGGEGDDGGQAAKKRRLERERGEREMEDVFGGPLVRDGAEVGVGEGGI